MKKILFVALIVLLLTAVVVVGLLPVLSRDGAEGTLDADMLNAYGATVNAAAIKTGIAAADKADITVPEDAVEISTAEGWKNMEAGGTYKLTADITVTDSLGTAEAPFGVVTVYGNGHTVTVSKPLFAYASELTVYELNLKGTVTGNGALAAVAEKVTVKYVSNSASVTGTDTVGGLVGTVAELDAYYCINTGAVSAEAVAGGLVGSVTKSANLEKCVNGDGTTGAVTAVTVAGGLVGKAVSTDTSSAVTVSECVNCAAVTVTDVAATSAAGGIAGLLDVVTVSVSSCTNNRGAVSGYGLAGEVRNGFGGIIGRAQGDASALTVQNCLNSGIITAQYKADSAHNNGVAGILGFDLCANTTVRDCCNIGAIRVTGGTVNAGLGGIVGQARNKGTGITTMYVTVEDCVNSGGINGGRPGGILGVAEHFTGVMLIQGCANSGDVTSPANYAGGIAARIEPNMAATTEVPYPVSLIGCSNSGNITAGGNCSAGIFAYCSNKVSTLYFEDCSNAGTIKNQQSGGIAGKFDNSSAVFKNCTNSGDIYSNGNAGGIAGNLNGGDGTFTGCTNTGAVYATNKAFSGGIAGNIGGKGTFDNCTNSGNVIANTNASSKGQLTGGICGRVVKIGSFTDCTNKGKIDGGDNQTGGILGEADGNTTFARCQNSGSVTSYFNDAAGILARAWSNSHTTLVSASFIDCVNTGTITSARYAGGIAGWVDDDGTYTNDINTGNVTGVLSVGGIVGVNSWKPNVTSCVNLGNVEGGYQVGGIAGSVCSSGHYNASFVGCVSMGDVYNNAKKADSKICATAGIVGYIWGVGSVTHCTVTGNIKADYSRDMGTLDNSQAVSAFAGYQNNNDGRYIYNTFTGTLNGGAYGKPVLIKSTIGATICNNTGDNELVKWNYSVNAYPFFIERHGDDTTHWFYHVEYSDDGKSSNHNDLTYTGWHVTSEQVRNGILLNTLNTAVGADTFEQVQASCDGESYPVYKDTAELLRAYVTTEHDYDYSSPLYDESGHWYVCSACGAKSDAESHSTNQCHDNNSHWEECACGYKGQKVAHTPELIYCDESYHGSVCSECGWILSTQLEKHSYTTCIRVGNSKHYYQCDCGDRTADVNCRYDQFDVTAEGHLMKCVCGNVSPAWRIAHTVFESGKYYTDANNHWQQCACGYRIDETAHSSETSATCLAKQVCKICGETFGSVDTAAHTRDIVWEQNATQHKGWYPCCGATVDWTDHTFEDGKCTVCDWVCEHTGGTATCSNKATCSYCGEQYGELDPNNHDTACTVTWNTDNTTNPDIRTKHKGTRTCGAAFEAADHTFENGACTVCGFNCVEAGCVGDHTETCQQKAKCIYCGEECGELGGHDFDTEHWVQDAENSKHYHACKTPDCTERDSETACAGGDTPTCVTKAVCDTCGNSYGAYGGHDYNTEEFIHIEGTDQHYNPCKRDGCTEQGNTESCSGGTATCSNKATCIYCGEQYGERAPTNHAGTAQSWRETEDGSAHYKVWDCCGDEVEGSRANHSFPKNGVTFACECGHACDHTCGVNYQENDGATHKEICKDCGYTDEKAHDYGEWKSRLISSDSLTNEGGSEWCHWRQCACGAEDGYESCTLNVHATCQAVAYCSVCGRVDTRLPNPNDHVWGDYTVVDDSTHSRICTLCQTPETGNHTFNNTPDCTACSYTCTHNTAKGVRYESHADDNTHQVVCKNCNYVFDYENHTVGTPADCMNQAVCARCGDKYGATSSEHSFDTVNWVSDGSNHWHECTVEGCEAKTDEAAHVYDRYTVADATHQQACVCGQTSGVPVEHQMDYAFDENGHWQVCATCGKSTESTAAEHSFTLWADARGHWEQCTCGATKGGDPIPHTFSAETGICTVEGCNYVCLHSGEYTYVADTENANCHDVYCNVCGKKIKEKTGHVYDLMDPHYVCEGNYHWIGCPCGAKLDAENGAIKHSTGAEGDLAATCKTRAYCSVCGSYYGELDPNNHATPEAFDYWTDPDDLGRHFKAWDCCGERVTNEAHTFENGICKYCDAGCIHTGGNANCKSKAICKICGVAYGELSTTHVYNNACDTDCNACGATRETAHSFGDWVEVLAPTVNAKGKEMRTCTVCGATDTYETDMLPAEEKDHTAVIVVSVVSGSVVGAGAIVCIGVWIVKSHAAAKIAAAQKPWRTKQPKKKKWKKKLKKKWNKNNNKRGDE